MATDRFSLDDVGDSLRLDVQAVLDALAPGLAELAAPTGPLPGSTALGAVADGGQTIAGSGSLIAADGLVAGGKALVRLGEAALAALAEAEAARTRYLRLAQEAEAALPVLARLLTLELERRRADADALAGTLDRRITAVLAGEPAEPVGAVAVIEEDMFSFEEAEAVPAHPAERRKGGTDVFTGADDAIREAFAQEAVELLDQMDQHAAALERGAAAEPLLRELFRAYHTFKGSANTVGLSALGKAAHRAEDVLEGWSPAEIDTRAAATALMRVQTALRSALAPGSTVPDPDWIAQELLRTRKVATDAIVRPATSPAEPITAGEPPRPAIPAPAVADEAPDGNRRFLRVAARHLDGLMHLAGELVTTRSRLSSRVGTLADAQRELAASRHRLVTTVDGFRSRHEFAGLDGRRQTTRPAPSGVGPRAPAPRTTGKVDALFTDLELDRYEDIHVLARSLNEITGDIGELQGQIQRAITDIGEDTEILGRSVTGIQGEITRARMVPLDQMFTRLHLAVQDAAERAGRQVRVTLAGGTVSLDKTIVDGIHTPLLHLVRNAVAHGIEATADRLAAGKPGEGIIAITARQEGGQIVVEVADDGRGLDLPALHRKGLELGLIDPSTAVDSEAVRMLVFAPGLSTAGQVDDVSGRGFGCDVAKSEIQRLNGAIGLNSRAHSGTTFTITLPLTLAISRALLVRIGNRRFAIPMNFVERVLDLDLAEISIAGGSRRVAYAGAQVRLVPVISLLTGEAEPERLPGSALIVRLGDQRWALPVDALLRQEDIVVNSLGELLAGHPLFAGVTLTGAGRLVPIIDLPGLIAADAPGTTRAAIAAPVAPRTAVATPQGPRRILFVDDSLSVRRVAEQQLTALGYTVVLANDGEDALGKLRAGTVDLVFTDLEMPRMHGYDLLREIRYIPAFRMLPVVVVSSRVGDKHRTLAEQLGASDYLGKPFTPDQLRQAVERLVPRP